MFGPILGAAIAAGAMESYGSTVCIQRFVRAHLSHRNLKWIFAETTCNLCMKFIFLLVILLYID